jgi:L-ribulose-5-phosphate 3-epimerase
MTMNLAAMFGIMQGRLSPPEEGRLQCFPRNSWRKEFAQARVAGLSYIEWIYDEYGASVNPITMEDGIAAVTALKEESGIKIPAICADWLMDFPLVRCSEQERAERECVLHQLLRWGKKIGASRVVVPFVDASSIQTEQEKTIVLHVLERALPSSEELGVEIHLEADFGPAEFALFLDRIRHPHIKVNYDTGNSSGLGYIAREEFAAYGGRIGSIHLKDRLRLPDGRVATRPLGHGSADFADVFDSIRKISYRGGFTLQVARGTDGDEVNWIRQQVAFVRRWA